MQKYFNVLYIYIYIYSTNSARYSVIHPPKKQRNQNAFPISKKTSLHVLLCWFLIGIFIMFKSAFTLVQKEQVQ